MVAEDLNVGVIADELAEEISARISLPKDLEVLKPVARHLVIHYLCRN